MKKKVLVVLLSLCLAFTAFALVGCGLFGGNDNAEENADFEFELVGDTYSVKFVGNIQDASEIVVPAEYNGVAVTAIADNAFVKRIQNHDNRIQKITLPDSIVTIGSGAFSGCDELTEINVPDGVATIGSYAFSGCYKLPALTLPESVTEIGKNAFHNCRSLTSIAIPSGVTIIESEVFGFCENLAAVTLPEGLTEIRDKAFTNCGLTTISVPSTVTDVNSAAFAYNEKLTGVYITDIGAWCKIKFGDSDGNPLAWAHKLYLNGNLVNDLVLPDNVTSIGSFAFCGSDITGVSIPAGVTEIGTKAFAGCDKLTAINVASGNANYKSVSGVLYDKSGTTLVVYAPGKTVSDSAVIDFTVPSGVKYIGESAFWGFAKKLRVTIPASVLEIRDYAFSNSDGLILASLSDGLTTIGNGAFYKCTSLPAIGIPSTVTSMGMMAFGDCAAMTDIYCAAKSKPSGWANDWNFGCDATVRWNYR